jgi:hypothetical protein
VIAVRVEGAVVHHVIQVREGTDDVEEELGAVAAADGEHRVPPLLPPILHLDGRGGGRFAGVGLLPVLVEQLVEPPVHVDCGGEDRPGAARAAAEDVPEPGLDALDPDRVVDRRARLLVADEHERRDAAAVRPRPGIDDAAAEVVQHGEDLGEQARAVGADELEQGRGGTGGGGRRQCRRVVGGEQRHLEAGPQRVGVSHLAALGVGDVEDVHEPAAVVGGDVALADADAVVGQCGHRLKQHAVLPRAVHLDQRRRRAHAVVHRHPAHPPSSHQPPLRSESKSKNKNPILPAPLPLPRGVHVAHEELVHLGRVVPLHRRNPSSPARFSFPASRDGCCWRARLLRSPFPRLYVLVWASEGLGSVQLGSVGGVANFVGVGEWSVTSVQNRVRRFFTLAVRVGWLLLCEC